MIPTKSTAYDSPVRKFLKVNTSTKSVHCKMFSKTDDSAGAGSIIDQSTIVVAEEDDTMVDLSELLDCTILYSESDVDDFYEAEKMGGCPENVLTDNDTVKESVTQLQKLM